MSTMLAWKLLLVPAFIGTLSLAGRRWGPAISGWLVGLPVVAGPVAFFLAVEQGRSFASGAARGTLAGLASLSAYALVYAWLSRRFDWVASLSAGWCAFLVSTLALERIPVPPLLLSFLAVSGIFLLVLRLLPGIGALGDLPETPAWEIVARMAAGAALVVAITGVARTLGPRLSGLLTPFPVAATVFTVFTHRFQGSAAAARLLRGLVTGCFTLAVFFLVVAATLEGWGIPASFGAATAACLVVQGVSLLLMRRAEART
ncbi:MAG: hypothetical protein ACM3NF_02350 [Gemmatimonadota bacterium]